MNAIERLWAQVKGIFETERSFRDVENWDDNPALWPDADGYCGDCLINLSSAAGKGGNVKSHCMLPIRGPSHDPDAYVRQAIAAAGTRLGRLSKPDDVPQAEWDAALQKAATKLVSLGEKAGEEMADTVYQMAGVNVPQRERVVTRPYTVHENGNGKFCVYKEADDSMVANSCHDTEAEALDQMKAILANEEQRSVAIQDVYQQLYTALMGEVGGESPGDVALVDLMVDQGQLKALLNKQGKLYRAPVIVQSNTAQLGAYEEVEMGFVPTVRSSVRIVRQEDGRHRFFLVAGTNVLNRSAEIDGVALYRSLVAEFRAGTHGPVLLDFYHEGPLTMGVVDWVETEGHALLASGLLDAVEDNALARAYVDATTAGRGQWGCSITYEPTKEPRDVEIAAGVTIPVYEAGVLLRIAILPEDKAASWYTTAGVEVTRMRKDVEEALKELFGNEAAAAAFIAGVDETNRAIDDSRAVTRAEEPKAEPAAAPPELVIDDATVARIAAQVVVPAPAAPVVDLTPVTERLAAIEAAQSEAAKRLAALEQTDEQKRQQWTADLPARAATTVTYRPREQAPTGEKPKMSDIAAASLARMPVAPGGGK